MREIVNLSQFGLPGPISSDSMALPPLQVAAICAQAVRKGFKHVAVFVPLNVLVNNNHNPKMQMSNSQLALTLYSLHGNKYAKVLLELTNYNHEHKHCGTDP